MFALQVLVLSVLTSLIAHALNTPPVGPSHRTSFPKIGEKVVLPGAQLQVGRLHPLVDEKQPVRRYAVHEDTLPAAYHHQQEPVAHQQQEAAAYHHWDDEEEDHYHHHHHYPHTPPKYAYKYSVHDDHTGDAKKAWEHRDGDVTHGGYTVLDPDGHLRIVEYTVTKKGGFQAKVRREPYY